MHLFSIDSSGIYNSRVARPNTDVSKDRKTSSFELELPSEKGGFSYIDSESSEINPSIFICAKPDSIRHTKFPFKCRYIHCRVFDSDLEKVLSVLPTFIHLSKPSEVQTLFDELLSYDKTDDTRAELMRTSTFLKLVCTLSLDAEKTDTHIGKENAAVVCALNFIDENLSENLTLESVARHVSLSPVWFHGLFKSTVGKTPREYIEEKRIEKSVSLLLTTDMTLTRIAYECGFSSQSYFSFAFKKKMNMTPREYVKMKNGNYKI